MYFFFQAEDGIRDHCVTGVQTCAFFFTSRRRHTRSLCDWGSDVCSSDLLPAGRRPAAARGADRRNLRRTRQPTGDGLCGLRHRPDPVDCRGDRRHHLVAADLVRRNPACADHQAIRPARQAIGGPAVSDRQPLTRSVFPAMTSGRWALAGLAVLLAAAIPLVMTNQYALGVMITTLILLVLNISWNFVLGVAGVWNFGQLALYALAGYGAGITMLHSSLSPWLALLAGGLVAMVAAILLAFPTLRLYGIYTSLLTFA